MPDDLTLVCNRSSRATHETGGVLTARPGLALVGAICGAVLGDAVSCSIGRRFGANIGRVWPFSRNPDLLPSGIPFFRRHGGKSVFIGRFFGPIWAVIPLAAGVLRMERGWFWFANVTSALVWVPMLLFVGDVIGEVGEWLIGSPNIVLLVFGVLIPVRYRRGALGVRQGRPIAAIG